MILYLIRLIVRFHSLLQLINTYFLFAWKWKFWREIWPPVEHRQLINNLKTQGKWKWKSHRLLNIGRLKNNAALSQLRIKSFYHTSLRHHHKHGNFDHLVLYSLYLMWPTLSRLGVTMAGLAKTPSFTPEIRSMDKKSVRNIFWFDWFLIHPKVRFCSIFSLSLGKGAS